MLWYVLHSHGVKPVYRYFHTPIVHSINDSIDRALLLHYTAVKQDQCSMGFLKFRRAVTEVRVTVIKMLSSKIPTCYHYLVHFSQCIAFAILYDIKGLTIYYSLFVAAWLFLCLRPYMTAYTRYSVISDDLTPKLKTMKSNSRILMEHGELDWTSVERWGQTILERARNEDHLQHTSWLGILGCTLMYPAISAIYMILHGINVPLAFLFGIVTPWGDCISLMNNILRGKSLTKIKEECERDAINVRITTLIESITAKVSVTLQMPIPSVLDIIVPLAIVHNEQSYPIAKVEKVRNLGSTDITDGNDITFGRHLQIHRGCHVHICGDCSNGMSILAKMLGGYLPGLNFEGTTQPAAIYKATRLIDNGASEKIEVNDLSLGRLLSVGDPSQCELVEPKKPKQPKYAMAALEAVHLGTLFDRCEWTGTVKELSPSEMNRLHLAMMLYDIQLDKHASMIIWDGGDTYLTENMYLSILENVFALFPHHTFVVLTRSSKAKSLPVWDFRITMG